MTARKRRERVERGVEIADKFEEEALWEMSTGKYRPMLCSTRARTISKADFELLQGNAAYICEYSAAEARELFPSCKSEIKDGVMTYALYRGDGQTVMITDDRWSAVARADEDDWEIVPWLN